MRFSVEGKPMTDSLMKPLLSAGSSNGLRYESGSAATAEMGCRPETFDGTSTSVLLVLLSTAGRGR